MHWRVWNPFDKYGFLRLATPEITIWLPPSLRGLVVTSFNGIVIGGRSGAITFVKVWTGSTSVPQLSTQPRISEFRSFDWSLAHVIFVTIYTKGKYHDHDAGAIYWQKLNEWMAAKNYRTTRQLTWCIDLSPIKTRMQVVQAPPCMFRSWIIHVFKLFKPILSMWSHGILSYEDFKHRYDRSCVKCNWNQWLDKIFDTAAEWNYLLKTHKILFQLGSSVIERFWIQVKSYKGSILLYLQRSEFIIMPAIHLITGLQTKSPQKSI